MNKTRKAASLNILCFLILLASACYKTDQKDQIGNQQKIKSLPDQKYVEPFVKCMEYYQMNDIRNIKNSGEISSYEYREFYDNLICPILDESQKTNIYELNSLYPELGTQFYTKFITYLKIIQNVKDKTKSDTEILKEQGGRGLFGNLIIELNKEKFDEDSNKLIKRAEILLNNWDDWSDENVDDINKALKDNYNSIYLIKSLKSAERYYIRGLDYYNKGEYDFAISTFDRALTISPNDDRIFQKRGDAYFYKGNYVQAKEDYSKAIIINMKSVDAYTGRGASHLRMNDYEAAVNDCSESIKLNSENPLAYNFRGQAYYKKRDFKLAFADLEKSISLAPNDPEFNLYFGLASFYINKYDYTIIYISKSLEILKADMFDFIFSRMKYVEKRKNTSEASMTDFNFYDLFCNIGDELFDKGKYTWAEECYLIAIKNYSDTYIYNIYYKLASIYSIRNELNTSLEYLKKCLQLHPQHLNGIEKDPLLNNLRKDSRYQEIFIEFTNQNK